jgi:N-acetylglucosamine malate deacetylase 2
MKKLLLLGLITALTSCSADRAIPTQSIKTILAVLAHPDDESAMGQILARYAREGNKVYLITSNDGRYGVEAHTGIPPGDSLSQIRLQETVCACDILGIEKPIFLGAHDGFGLLHGLGEYFKQTAEIKKKLTEAIIELNPDAILTFGPDGDTGNVDHKGISDLVTEVIFMNEGFYEKYPVFYLAWPKEKEVWLHDGFHTGLNYVDKKYRNIHISYTEEDRSKLFKSLECYKTQLTNEGVEKWIEAELKDTTFTTYFRQLITHTKVRTEF